jgi:hypothetical protein
MPAILGYASVSDATNETRSMWIGADLVVRIRIAAEPSPETVEPNELYGRDDFSEMSYKVYREVDGFDGLVDGYESVAIAITDAIPPDHSLPRTWGKDGVGYNFRHVVPAAAFASNAIHRIIYRFLTASGETIVHPVMVHVQGPTGDTASAGSGEITGNPGPQGLQGIQGDSPYTFDVTNAGYEAVGDGVTDNTSAIQAAINDAATYTAANAGEYACVFVPAGTFITGQLNISGNRIILDVEGAVKFADDDTASDHMIDVTGDHFELIGRGTLNGNEAGDVSVGNGIRLQGRYAFVEGVKVRNFLDQGILVHDPSRYTTIKNVTVEDCPRLLRVRGDYCAVHDSRFLGATSSRGITIDPAYCDAQFFMMKGCHISREDAAWIAMMLIDPGDNAVDGTSAETITCGAPTNVGGRAQYAVDKGHGFQPGDGFLVAGSGDDDWNRCHRIIACGGDLFVRKITDTTFEVYDTAAHAIAATDEVPTGRIELTSGATGTEFYVTTPRGGRRQVNVSGGINTSTHRLTTTEDHEFWTGEPLRVTRGEAAWLLPPNLRDGWVRVRGRYSDAGTNVATTYTRPKRIDTVILEGNTYEAPNTSLSGPDSTSTVLKVQNVNNLFISGKIQNSMDTSYDGTTDDVQSLRTSGNIRKAYFRNLELSDGFIVNPSSNVTRLVAEQCSFGDGYNVSGEPPLKLFCAQHAIFRQCSIRGGVTLINWAMLDEDLEWLEFDDCEMVGYSTSRTNIVREANGFEGVCVTGGKILFRPNCRRYNTLYAGLTATPSASTNLVTATAHTLKTGDSIYFTAEVLPTGINAGQEYYVRVVSRNTFYVYETLQAVYEDPSDVDPTPFYFDFADAGTNVLVHSPDGKIGMTFNGDNQMRNIIWQTLDSPFDLYDVTKDLVVGTQVNMPSGVRVWNPNALPSTSQGWVTIKPTTYAGAIPASAGATVATLPALGALA